MNGCQPISRLLRGHHRKCTRPEKRNVFLFSTSSVSAEKKQSPQERAKEKGLVNASTCELPTSSIPSKAKVLICGGGAQGAAIAYKLAQRGLGPETVILDKGNFGSGTTLHSSGMVGILKNSHVETKLSQISKNLYFELEDKGYYTGWNEVGSLYLAQTKERMHHFKRLKSQSVGKNVVSEIVGLDRIKELCPLIRTDGLQGGLWVPEDGVANPVEICLALAILASKEGVRIVNNCEINDVVCKNGAVSGVQTNQGFIECENFVNTAGIWARHLGTLSYPRVQVPLGVAEHYVLHTTPVNWLPDTTPVVRDMDARAYFRENEGRFLMGGFESVAKPAFRDDQPPGTGELPHVDWDHFFPIMRALTYRCPSMGKAKLSTLTNNPEPFSPDGQWVLGQSSEMRNYFIAAAMRSIGVGAAGGVGEVIADYITKGRSSFDMYNLDIGRFLPMHNNRRFLGDRVKEVPGLLYSIPYPFAEYKTGRALRTSPIFTKLKDHGARFNQVMGYERPMYFQETEETSGFVGLESIKGDTDASSLTIAKSNTFFKPSWFDCVKEEFTASREAVSLCDFSSFAKMDLWSGGKEVVDFLQNMCSNDVDVPIGSIVHTGMHNERGGYENDCTLARIAENKYFLMSPSIQQMRSFAWMKSHLPRDDSVFLEDVTSAYTTLCLMGPLSKNVLEKLTKSPLDPKSFPVFTIRHLDIDCAPKVLTMNVTHTGELGYVFYVQNEFALHVFESLVEAGQEFGMKQCGYYSMRALRIEKFYAFWGQDLDSQSTPLECGRDFRVKIGKSDIDFIGRDALIKQKKEGIHRMLVMLLLDPVEHNSDTDPWPWGGEPIFRDGKHVGNVTTASYGFSLNRQIALGHVHKFGASVDEKEIVTNKYVKSGDYEIEIAGVRYPATVRLQPPILPMKPTASRPPGYAAFQATRHRDTTST